MGELSLGVGSLGSSGRDLPSDVPVGSQSHLLVRIRKEAPTLPYSLSDCARCTHSYAKKGLWKGVGAIGALVMFKMGLKFVIWGGVCTEQ